MSYTTWQPSVCKCVISYSNKDPDGDYSFKNKCELHSALPDGDALSAIRELCAALPVVEELTE